MNIYKRISGRVGNKLALNMTFLRNGIPTKPYAIRTVKIYQQSIEDTNLLMEVPFVDPDSPDYPHPAIEVESPCIDPDDPTSDEGGSYKLIVDIPCDFPVPNLFLDAWHFIPDINCLDEVTAIDLDDESLWQVRCGKFWVYPDGWYADDNLMVPQLGFEPLNVQFRSGEVKWMEVGVMPLPLYDANYCQIMPMIPYLQPSISITTRNCETIVSNEEMEIGLRQGAYRTNPYVFKYLLDTNKFIMGTYNYQITVKLPDCQTIVSPKYTFTIS